MATRAVGRDLAEGFLERRPEIVESVRDVAGVVGETLTESVERAAERAGDGPIVKTIERAIERATAAGVRGIAKEVDTVVGTLPPAPREHPRLDRVVRKLGEEATAGATEALRARVGLGRYVVPFGLGVIATALLMRLPRRGRGSEA